MESVTHTAEKSALFSFGEGSYVPVTLLLSSSPTDRPLWSSVCQARPPRQLVGAGEGESVSVRQWLKMMEMTDL